MANKVESSFWKKSIPFQLGETFNELPTGIAEAEADAEAEAEDKWFLVSRETVFLKYGIFEIPL